MTSPADGANGNLLSSGGIDRSVGYLIVGVGVILFFLLTLMGMQRVQTITTEATRPPNPNTAPVDTSEIVGSAPAAQ